MVRMTYLEVTFLPISSCLPTVHKPKDLIESEMRFAFSAIIHLVDSETVLKMLHKLSTRFKVYEGVRIGEIQSATKGDVSCWGWVPGKLNIADWVTRSHSPKDLGPDSDWYKGPEFLSKPIEEWGIRRVPSSDSDVLPGEKKVSVNSVHIPPSKDSYSRCSKLSIIVGAFARVLGALRERSFAGGRSEKLTPDLLREAEVSLVKGVQVEWSDGEFLKSQFRTLNPVVQDGIWVVGARISQNSPMTPENKPQMLLPYDNPLTKLLMEEMHRKSGHKGRDATLARFRARFWASRASKLSKSVCDNCQTCKLLKPKYLSQVMGEMPPPRLLPSPPFTHTMVDLFGPFSIRGEVQKRTTSKVWGALFTDLCSRALHIEVAPGYDTQSFLLALDRFAAIRGWPSELYSDPGSQLKASADIIGKVSFHGTKWMFSPADSPWRQGAAEALIKSVKQAFLLAVKNQRLSLSELQTVFSSIANGLNERPIGILPSVDSIVSVLTPNSLLLGRSTADNPGGYEPTTSLLSRLSLVKSVEEQFWSQWTQLYAPTLVYQTKWKHPQRDLQVDDVVLVLDPNPSYKGKFKLARVVDVHPGKDGKVRKVTLGYKNYRVGEKVYQYSGVQDTLIERSVQRLVLLVPVEH